MIKLESFKARFKNVETKLDQILAYVRTQESAVKPTDWPETLPLPTMLDFYEWEVFLMDRENYEFAVRTEIQLFFLLISKC